jgi:excisionase family DNA binding protein
MNTIQTRVKANGYATIYRWIKAGTITPIKIAGRTLIPKSEVDRLKKKKQESHRQ